MAAADAPAPAIPRMWIRSRSLIGRAARAGARPAPSSSAVRVTAGLGPLEQPAKRRSGRRLAVRDAVAVEGESPHLGARSRRASPTYVSPTGFASEPPSGPATPVIETASAAANLARAPAAMATATWALTAPCASSVAGGTSSIADFAASA